MKIAFALTCCGKPDITPICLYALAQMEVPNVSVAVFLDDTNDQITQGMQAGLNLLTARHNLLYRRTQADGLGADRAKILQRALNSEPDLIVSLDSDVALPEHFLTSTLQNLQYLENQPWGFIGIKNTDVLDFNREGKNLQQRFNPDNEMQRWMEVEDYNERLWKSYSASGGCIIFNARELEKVAADVFPLCRTLNFAEDGLICMALASKVPCFTAKSPTALHFRSRTISRMSEQKLNLSEEAAVLLALKSKNLISDEVTDFLNGCRQTHERTLKQQ